MKIENNLSEWTAVEDNILIAGVMKYGCNKWGKVASLLMRSQSECRYRFENVYKGELSREEAIETVNLCRIFPGQHRLVGRIMGKSPSLCYKFLCRACLGLELDRGESSGQTGPMANEQYLVEIARERMKGNNTRKRIRNLKAPRKGRPSGSRYLE